MSLIPILGRQRLADLYELQASLVYRLSCSRSVRALQRNAISIPLTSPEISPPPPNTHTHTEKFKVVLGYIINSRPVAAT
jgi:hypothetical protein